MGWDTGMGFRRGAAEIIMKAEDLAWIIALPAAAECIASVWLPEMEMGGYDVKTIFLNVSGAAL